MRMLMLFGLLVASIALQANGVAPGIIVCQGSYPGHLQGIDTDGSAIYWSFTTRLVKTDVRGQVLVCKEVVDHHGDLCVHDGQVYVAVNRGNFNQEQGAISEVWVYEAHDLTFSRKYQVPELVHGAGGMTWHGGSFFVVGGLPKTHVQNYVYEYKPDFTFVKRHVLDSGYTVLGIQTASFIDGRFWFGTYGCKTKPETISADPTMKELTYHRDGMSVGMMKLNGVFYRADTRIQQDKSWTGRALPASRDLQK